MGLYGSKYVKKLLLSEIALKVFLSFFLNGPHNSIGLDFFIFFFLFYYFFFFLKKKTIYYKKQLHFFLFFFFFGGRGGGGVGWGHVSYCTHKSVR